MTAVTVQVKMNNLTDIGYIYSLLNSQRTHTKKSLGQNFLTNPAVAPRMAELCGVSAKDGVLEIGCGIGVLTVELSKRAKKVVGVEVDKTLIPILDKTLSDCNNVEIVNGDIMKTDIKGFIAEKFGEPVFICANLPYYITTPVIMRLLSSGADITAMTFMVQREYAERLVAAPSTEQYGALTLSVGYRAETQILFDVSSGSFTPRPKVESSVVKLTLYEKPPVNVLSEELLFDVIKAAFAKRRKMLRGALSAFLPSGQLLEAFEESLVSPTARGETLGLVEFARLSDAIYNKRRSKDG